MRYGLDLPWWHDLGHGSGTMDLAVGGYGGVVPPRTIFNLVDRRGPIS